MNTVKKHNQYTPRESHNEQLVFELENSPIIDIATEPLSDDVLGECFDIRHTEPVPLSRVSLLAFSELARRTKLPPLAANPGPEGSRPSGRAVKLPRRLPSRAVDSGNEEARRGWQAHCGEVSSNTQVK